MKTLSLIPHKDNEKPFDESVTYPQLDSLKEFTALREMIVPSVFLIGKVPTPVGKASRRSWAVSSSR
jgi:hypothetical protein